MQLVELAGGVYVPIDPTHPPGRIQEIVQTVGIRVASASPTCRLILEKLISPEDLSIIQVQDGFTLRPWLEPLQHREAEEIIMPHRAICTSILHHGPALGAGPNWRTLQFCAHTFELSIAEFFTTLSFSGCICVPSEEDRTNNLAGVITSLAANTLIVVLTVANILFPDEVPILKTFILSGEPIPKESITHWADHVNLICAYGPSETAVCAILGSGYFGDKATTHAAFVMAPEWIRELTGDTMLYRSGDLGRYNPDGSFQVVGRRDTQVKLRGLRIELGEIENRLT
ncbi:peptide synthetase [Xylariales sp. AK1849]|nr:peptide synthetase [Xylariales sp. AK1849]